MQGKLIFKDPPNDQMLSFLLQSLYPRHQAERGHGVVGCVIPESQYTSKGFPLCIPSFCQFKMSEKGEPIIFLLSQLNESYWKDVGGGITVH